MYSKIPMPQVEWTEKNMRYAICFFPLVGAVISLLEYLLLRYYPLFFTSGLLRASLILFIPLAVTGGIHLDGFMDTNDALCSYADRARRLEILKDPHIGAFSAIHLAMYVILFLGFSSIIDGSESSAWCLIFILSRILSGLSVVSFPCAKKEGSLYAFAKDADRIRACVIFLAEGAACVAFLVMLAPVEALSCTGTALVLFWIYHVLAVRKFGGITGDVAGWFLCNAELWMTIAFTVAHRIVQG